MTLVLIAAALVTADPAVLGKRFPLQYELWRRPSRIDRTWNEKRGHAFSLKDRDESIEDDDPRWRALMAGKPKPRPVPAGCLECHAAETVAAGSYWEGRRQAKTPVACISCHDPDTLALRPSRSGVCARCHTDYYLEAGAVRRPEATVGLEALYDRARRGGWIHAATGAAIIEPRHPQFQMWSQGIHARSGVQCADCHMPRIKLAGARITDHNARSPRENVADACGTCHRLSADELRARIDRTQQRIAETLSRALDAVADLIASIRQARAAGVRESALAAARDYHRRAQWRVSFVRADGSRGFHAPGEAAELLLEAIDYARKGQLAAEVATPSRTGSRTTRP